MHTGILLFIKVGDIRARAGIQQKTTEINMTFIYGILISSTLELGSDSCATRSLTARPSSESRAMPSMLPAKAWNMMSEVFDTTLGVTSDS